MKTYIKYLIILLVFAGCTNDDNKPKPKTELEKLPPATQTGANTAGCLVNGIAFLPKGFFSFGNKSCNYTENKNFNIRISEKKNDDIRSVYIFNDNEQIETGNIYLLKQNLNNILLPSGYAIFSDFTNTEGGDFITTNIVTGELKITNHNYNQAIISGVFWFDAVNSNGEKVEIREGRFDMHY